MKKLLIILMLLSAPCLAQVEIYGTTGGGCLFQEEDAAFAFTVGGNVNMKTDEATGFKVYSQTQFKYSDGVYGSGEIQEMSNFIMNEKSVWKNLYMAVGSGAILGVKSGEDNFDMAVKAEIGYEIGNKVGLAVGVEYVPVNDSPNRTFVYGAIDLLR